MLKIIYFVIATLCLPLIVSFASRKIEQASMFPIFLEQNALVPEKNNALSNFVPVNALLGPFQEDCSYSCSTSTFSGTLLLFLSPKTLFRDIVPVPIPIPKSFQYSNGPLLRIKLSI